MIIIWTQAVHILWQVHLPDEDDHSILQFKIEYHFGNLETIATMTLNHGVW